LASDALLLCHVTTIGVRANFFLGGLSHLCPKNFSTAPEKLQCKPAKLLWPTHPTQYY